MKKILSVITLATAAVFMACSPTQRYNPESDFEVEPIAGGTAVRIFMYVGESWEVRIPPQIRGLPVTHIGGWAFNEGNLISVTIPDTVTHIEGGGQRGAFQGNQLTSVTIPNSVTTIGSFAFANNHLTNITIPDSVTHIGAQAFRGNPLDSITIGADVQMPSGFNCPFQFVLGSGSFAHIYTQVGRRAGTFTREVGGWIFLER